ncbi:uncharacterized protein [Diadema antillarum]|uniref:uncharacterized protein n=1 Tax=Diadema antillarum TaxID=105358 RepID=UPI003A87F679
MTYYNDESAYTKKFSMSHGGGSPNPMVDVEPEIAFPKQVKSPNPPPSQPPKRTTYFSIIVDFADSTTAHGLPRIVTSEKWYWKIFWFLIFGGAFYLFTTQALDILWDYRSYPYNTKIDVVTETTITFPSVTICNMNRMKRSQLVGTRFEGIVEIDGGFSDDGGDYSWWFDFSSDFWNTYYSSGYSWGGGGGFSSSSAAVGRRRRDTPYDNFFDDFELVPEAMGDDEEDFQGLSREKRAGSSSSSSSSSAGSSSAGSSSTGSSSAGSSSAGSSSAGSSSAGSSFSSSSYGFGSSSYGFWSSSYAWGGSSSYYFGWNSYSSGGWSSYWDNWFEEWDSWGNDLWGSWTFEYDDYYDWGDLVEGESDWEGFYENSRADDFSDIIDVANPTRLELEELGHQPEDIILQCTFDKRSCNYTDFRMWQNKAYGNCFTFNHGDDNSTMRTTSKSGSTYGLHMTLFIEQPEYVGLFSQETGVRVTIHHPSVTPYPEDVGITAPTGQATSIGIRQNFIERLPEPHGNCTHDGSDTQFQDEFYSYSTLACKKQCVLDEMWDRCGCVNDIVGDQNKCSYLNSTEQKCRQLIESLNNDGKLECYCPSPCSETVYVYSASGSLWPSERYEEHLYSRVSESNEIAARILQNVETTRKNLARVRIYFEELNFQSIVQTKAYTFVSFLSSVGGLLGLYIGFSVVTLVEIILLFLEFLKHTLFGACCNNKIQPVVA